MPQAKSGTKTEKDQKPYDRPKKERVLSTATIPKTASEGTGRKVAGGSGYNKHLLVSLVIKSANDIKWDDLSQKIGKTPTQCKDVWRKVVSLLLLTNKSWTISSKGWNEGMKLDLLMCILDATKPDWEEIKNSFPGKTKTQIHDTWRKVILPRLKRGDTIE